MNLSYQLGKVLLYNCNPYMRYDISEEKVNVNVYYDLANQLVKNKEVMNDFIYSTFGYGEISKDSLLVISNIIENTLQEHGYSFNEEKQLYEK